MGFNLVVSLSGVVTLSASEGAEDGLSAGPLATLGMTT